MPKTKEQKQKEALQRQAVNFYRSALRELLACLPGGYLCNGKHYLHEAVASFKNVMMQAATFGIAIPYSDRIDNYAPADQQLHSVLSQVWISQLTDLYEKGCKQHGVTEAHYQLQSVLSDTGKAREGGDLRPISKEVVEFRQCLHALINKNKPQRSAGGRLRYHTDLKTIRQRSSQ